MSDILFLQAIGSATSPRTRHAVFSGDSRIRQVFPSIGKAQLGLGLERRVILQVSCELGIYLLVQAISRTIPESPDGRRTHVNIPRRLEVDDEFRQDVLALGRNIPGLRDGVSG